MKVSDLLKTTNIIKVHPHETLSSAISKLSSSHDAAFVFSMENNYMGIVNPYYSLIKSSSPANARIEHCLFHASKLHLNDSIQRAAQLMNESKVHYLPVMDSHEQFVGIVSARRILSVLKDNDIFNVKISEVLRAKRFPLITVANTDFVSTAVNELKKYKVSKLVVINKEMKLCGVLSYYDLISFLILPKKNERKGERKGNKISLNHQRVSNFSKNFILTLTAEKSIQEALKLIIDKKIGSIVVVDNERHPVGIITTKDMLSLLAKNGKKDMLEIISHDVSKENRQIIGGFFNQFNTWVNKIPGIVRARLFIKEVKNGQLFKVSFSLFPKKGEPKVIKQEGKNLVKILKKIKKD